jgi:hypothetical protein
MKQLIFILLVSSFLYHPSSAQVDLKAFKPSQGVKIITGKDELSVQWQAGANQRGHVTVSTAEGKPLLKTVGLYKGNVFLPVAENIDPVFLLTVGKRDLVSQNGWNIFFDKVPLKPFQSHKINFNKKNPAVRTIGSRTIISIGEASAPGFTGNIEITLYTGTALLNIAAVVSTKVDSTAIVYDAGLVSSKLPWQKIGWSTTDEKMNGVTANLSDTARNEMVKYRTIIGETTNGSIAVFPAPHQYFYPLDEAFNLKFTWHGNGYRKMVDGYGIGIRQDLYGDRRFVPWFNAPPGTKQRLNYFCLLNAGNATAALEEVKKFTNNDRYVPLPGYKTMASHFHNEFIMKVVLAGKPVPDTPSFVTVFKRTGIDMVHLGEFHYTAHPKGPDSTRLKELHALFEQCERLSDKTFLLIPGEEPNEFFGGHWLQVFPKPVYWIMSRKPNQPFVTQDPEYGTVYRIANATEMLDLLQRENGLAWTAHPRTKGSTGYPDKYKNDSFFLSDRFLGAAWKPMPADLSIERSGVRVLDLLDDMNNWGTKKKVLAEADLFTIEPENEMYAHLNVNYMQVPKLPEYKNGWAPVTYALQRGRFFSTTGEVLIPSFGINGKGAGDTLVLGNNKSATLEFDLRWTFPMNYAELISGDGKTTTRYRINLDTTTAFGAKRFRIPVSLQNQRWVRLEAWDVAANGAFTQTIWIQ